MISLSSADFWDGKRVLITGGYGFLASHLAAHLAERNALVTVTVRHRWPVQPARALLRGLDDCDVEWSDLLDPSEVQQICNRHEIDTIFHLAASAIVSTAARAPWTTAYNNVVSTLNVLEASRITGVKRVIIASSDKAYGDHADEDDPEQLPYEESYGLRGLDVYSSSKVCTDVLAQTFAYQFNLPVIVARCCNIYGPGDLNFTRLVPRTISRLLADKRPVIHKGNTEVLREYIYITDVVHAYVLLAERLQEYYGAAKAPKHGRRALGWCAFNIGNYTDQDFSPRLDIAKLASVKSVSQIIDLLRSLLDKRMILPQEVEKNSEFIEIRDQVLDSTKIRNLGFKPAVSLEQGLRQTCDWYRAKWSSLANRCE